MHFPLEKLCPAVKPLVVPHIVHVLGSEQVASFQLCPLALPSVAPQEQVFGAVQVAELKLCVCGGSVVGAVVGLVVGAVVGSVVGGIVGSVADSAVGVVVDSVVDAVVVSKVDSTVESLLVSVVMVAVASSGALASVLGAVKIVTSASMITMISLSFPFMYLFRMACHFEMGITSATIRTEIKLEKLGKYTMADSMKNMDRIQRPTILPFFILYLLILTNHLFLHAKYIIFPMPAVVKSKRIWIQASLLFQLKVVL